MSKKRAIVIGASRGIGLGLVRELAERGYRVLGTERSESAELHEAAAYRPHSIDIMPCDVTDPASVARIRDLHPERCLDLLILNAGIYGDRPQELDGLARDNIAGILMTNAVGPVQAALALLPLVKESGTIGLMSSKMGSIDDSSGGSNLYRLSKVAQNMLARSLFEQHAGPRGVGVISLHPGWVQTDMGGPNALIDVDTSVSGMVEVLEAEDAPRHAFLAYDGTPVPW